jgi:RNA polymerase sigma-70 factor (ECF subfamily)
MDNIRHLCPSAIEEELACVIRAGDLNAMTTVALRGYGPMIFRYVRSIVHDEEQAFEVFSRFSENLWKNIGRFRAESTFRTWAYRIAWCTAIDHLREAKRRREQALTTGVASRLADPVRTATPAYLAADTQKRFAALRAELDADDRSLLVLRVEQGLSWKEVAAVMAVDEAALRKRFERLKRRLRELAPPVMA